MHSSTTRSTRVGPQKLYSKLINKINNFPHKSNKLAVKQQPPLQITSPLQPEHRKKTLVIDTVGGSSEREYKQEVATNGHYHDYENVIVSRLPSSGDNSNKRNNRGNRSNAGLKKSGGALIPLTATAAALFSSGSDKHDEQYACSLEDEIFEELEKVAHDEAKLCAALENFDKILSEYNGHGLKSKTLNTTTPVSRSSIEPPNVTINSIPPSLAEVQKVAASRVEIIAPKQRITPPKLLHKSKTCSIIESRCILKKPDPDDETRQSTVSLPNAQLSNVSLTRSLLNLKDLEEFAKATAQRSTPSSSPSPTRLKDSCNMQTERSERASKNYNTYKVKNSSVICSTDNSNFRSPRSSSYNADQIKNQLPRAKSVWELGNSSPPNTHAPASRTSSGSKIPVSTNSSRSNSFILSNGSTLSLLSGSAAKLNDCRLRSNETSGNKIRSSTSTSSICTKPLNGKIQTAVSEANLRSHPRSYKKSKENGDELLSKCLEKGQEILKKVEELSCANHHQKGKIKLTVKSTFQSHGMKSSTSSTIRLDAPDEIDGCHNPRPTMAKLNSGVWNNASNTNNSSNSSSTTTNNRKDTVSSAHTKGFVTLNKLNSNDDISLHGHSKSQKCNLVSTASCPASTSINVNNSSGSRCKKQQNNVITISSKKQQTNNSATQTSSGAFELKSTSSVPVLSHLTSALGRASDSRNSVMEQKNYNNVKGKNIVKNCISNFENQCKISSANAGRVINNQMKHESTRAKFVPGKLTTGRTSAIGSSSVSAKAPAVGEKRSPNWKPSNSTISVLAIAPPLKSPALVKQNKLINLAANTAGKPVEVIAPIISSEDELFPLLPTATLLPVTLTTTNKTPTPPTITTVIVVPPSPLPPSDEPEQQPSGENLNRLSRVRPNEGSPKKRDGEEDYDEEDQRVIDHLKCVNKKNNSVKEETYQSDCSDDSGHISNLVKQNKLINLAANTAGKPVEVIAPIISSEDELFPLLPTATLLPVTLTTTNKTPTPPTITTVIVVPPSPLPPSDEPEQQPSGENLNRLSRVRPNEGSPKKRDGEEDYDEEDQRVIDHLKCVNKKNNSVKEETYQSDCSDDSGHISNENNEHEENLKIIPGKLTDSLLEIFEQSSKKGTESDENGGGRVSSLYELCNSTGACDNSDSTAVISESKKLPNRKEVKLVNATAAAIATAKTANGSCDVVVSDKNVAASCVEIMPLCNAEVLFRSGVLNQLEAKRDELLSGRIIQLQAYCRGHLARKRLAQRRVQELAVKCIQRNVRAFLKVREWAWWRLLVRVTPLLNVHRTEEQLKIATTELQVLKAKLDKVESERNNLKTENSKLELRLSDMTAELAEEHSSSNVISERLDAETTERLRLEKEVKEHETKYRNLQESSEKLEMELLCAKSDLNGDLDDDLEGDDAGSNAYRLKYERVARELEFTKKRLQTQHEHDLEQLIGLKKQLEKKLADAYEEVEEQRQVVGQWKRKAQKMTNEMNDLRMLLEEQNSRNNLLEKRQRKFDSECQALQDSARQEKQAKERLTREKDVLIAEKFTIEQTLSDVRLELELKEEKYSALQRELDEMTFGGGTEEEIAQLKRQKMELDRRCKEQEEELDEMAGQIQLLEQAKLRLEMSLETMRKGARKESQQRDEELEEVRGSSYKKIKTLECQLEQEHEERTLLLREKHELERRLNNLEEHDRSERAAEEAASQKLKRDLRKYKALLRDAQTQLERAKADSAGKALIRQLRNQLEDAESARSAAVKARQAAEGELQDVQLMLEEAQRARYDAEDKATSAQRDRTELQAQIDENEEEMAELMKKYSSTVKQLSSEQTIIADNEFKISELESEKKSLKEQIFELTSRLENVENIGDSSSSIQFKRLELRTKEIESRLELEQANRARTEVQLQRHKDSLEKAQHEVSQTRTKEMHAQEALKKSQKTIRELREELHIIANKEQESLAKRKDLEKRLESVEAEAASARADLRLALQRIADLQQAMEEGDSYHSDSENSDSSIDSVGEMSYRSPSSVTLRARSGQSNGTSTNGSSTTLCIREEKENTPRIRPKFNLIGLRRRRLPFTIHEEDEDESALTTTLGKAENDVSDGIDNCIESIKRTIGDGSESGLEQSAGPSSTLTDSPKYTGAIKKTINITVKSLKCNEPQKKSQSSLNEMRTKVDGESNNVSSKMCTDANNNLSENVFSKHVQSISDPNVASDLMDTSVVLANQIQNDSRFDLDALKSIKEKIKNLNRSLKEEAAQERCSRFEFPPLSTKPDVLVTEEPSINKDVTKLDQLEAQLNLDGIRSMKEKIQNLKKKLQEDSTSTMTANKEDIINEISEMKKALTVAFLNKGCERRSLSRSSSERDDSSTSSFKREDNSLHSLKSDQNSSSSLKSVDSSNLDLKQAKELTKPPAVNKLAPAHEEINNLSPTSYSGSMDSGPMRVSSLNQVSNSEIKRDPFAFATIDNVVERKLMVIGNDQSATVHNSPSTISCAVNKVLLEVDSSDEALKIESAIQPEADSRYIISADYNPVNDDINVRSKNDEPNVKTTTEGKCTMEAELHQLDINIISERNVGKSTINTIIEDTDSPQSQSTIFSNATLPFESAQRNDLLNSMMVHRMPIVSPLQSIVLENKLENTQLNSSFELELVKQIDVYDQNLIIDEHTQESEKVFPINQEEYIDDTTTESIGVVERHQHEVVKDGESLTNPEKNVSYKCDEPSDVESPYSTDIVERMESTDKEHLQVQTNSCFKTKDCRCENIDQTIEMLVTSMEQSSPSQSLSKPCIQSSIDMNSDTNDDIKSTMTTLSEDIDILPNINLTSADKHLADMTILTPVSTIDVSEQYTPVSLSNIDGNNNETNWIANSENEYIDPEENTKSNQTSQQATLTEFVAKNNIFSDLANGDFVETTTLQTPHKKVDESSLPINDPIEDIPNQVSERALAIDSSVLLNECSSRSVIPLHAIVVSTDVMTDTLVSTPASSSSKSGNLGQQQKPLSYAESLKKARSPPKSCPQHMTRSSALAEAKQACKTEPAAKTNRKPQHQSIHQRERHSSLARGGNNPSKDIRQSKSASKLNSKEISLPNGKPTELKQSKSVAQEQQNISLARKKNNRSNPNLLVDKKFSISNNGNGIKLEQPERNRHRTQAVNNKKK
ncbi:uncharacterized protein LOC131690615 isoform X2 [Topomyia yanbarensis]|uniref:uncharacterized protein LOC131690615 isoform X2 n=1 Tax=Topomyia yanbarensis TaxID=2498891 RepID=UPI00273C8467|nr:uncharacterized protein LOC131690615 isoform X2 [Topomyia yanbarensis]